MDVHPGCPVWLLQRRLWLLRPVWEKQSLPQKSHLCVVSGQLELLRSFLGTLFPTSGFTSFLSPDLRCVGSECFSTSCGRLQGPPRTQCWCRFSPKPSNKTTMDFQFLITRGAVVEEEHWERTSPSVEDSCCLELAPGLSSTILNLTTWLAEWLRHPPRERQDRGSIPVFFARIFRSGHTSDLKIDRGFLGLVIPVTWKLIEDF